MSIQFIIRNALPFLAVLFFASASFAQEEPNSAESCKKAAESCKNVKFRNSECDQLNKCKMSCRQDKKGCKDDARSEKRECRGTVKEARSKCMSTCKGKKGRSKRQCKRKCRKISRGDKKDCRKDKRATKKDCRHVKRDCFRDCRKKYRTPACTEARKKSAVSWAKCAGRSAKCVADIAAENKSEE